MNLSPRTSARQRLYWASLIEGAVNRRVSWLLRRRGWRPSVLAYTGYGTAGEVRVLGRVLLAPPRTRQRDLQTVRGWRRFLAITAPGVPLTVDVGGHRHRVVSTRGGYVDVLLPAELAPGWGRVAVSVGGSTPSEVPVFIVGDHPQTGIVSDIDDTVMITALPRPLLAFWNTFGRHEAARRPVPGMADLYRSIAAENPDGIVVYLSTGAWNVAPAIEGFLGRHGFPRGPLLLTDWGPTADAWFRSGKAHKRTALARLIAELPQVSWILVGDDGQHDPELYCEAACAAPGQVRAIAVRELTVAQQLRTHGSAVPPSAKKGQAPVRAPVPEVRGPDGIALVRALRDRGVLAAARLDATVGADDDSSGRASSDVR
ncbi:MAG: hypothetical protein QOG80_1296 [Pseudonocardiales bacterium]|nr:hypothetical protein [Pseudonocardiales bacterium]